MKFDKEFKQVLLGSMCGDGHLMICPKPMYREAHCLKQKNYLHYKIKFLWYIIYTRIIRIFTHQFP